MKNLIIAFGIFFMTSIAFAESECFDFSVSKYATDLTKIRITISSDGNKKNSALIRGITADKNITTPFVCEKDNNQLKCVQELGGGDFILVPDNPASLTFSYINLAIGATGAHAAKPKKEVDEEFALLNTTPSDDDDEEEAGHLTDITIQGIKVSCDLKM